MSRIMPVTNTVFVEEMQFPFDNLLAHWNQKLEKLKAWELSDMAQSASFIG